MRRSRGPAAGPELELIELPPSGQLRLVVVSDTHSRPHPSAQQLIREQRPDAILHAGDIGSLAVLDQLAELAPVHAVRGNIDGRSGPPDTLLIDLVAGSQLAARVLLLHIGVHGPRLNREARELARQTRAQIVVCGHSHVPLLATQDGIAVFNPGSIGPLRFGLPITFGVIELDPDGFGFRHVDCETGSEWRPPGVIRAGS